LAPRTILRRLAPLLLAGLAAVAIAEPAQATVFGPRAGHSPNADDIRTAYWVAIAIAALVVIAVNAFLIAAVVRFMNGLDTAELRGRITAVPIVSMPSFRARTAFVMPQDGKNLNRCFPGSDDGTFSDVLARRVYDELIAPSDFLLDLHGGDMVEALEPFSLYDESAVEEQARGLDAFVLLEPREGPAGWRSVVAAPAGGQVAFWQQKR